MIARTTPDTLPLRPPAAPECTEASLASVAASLVSIDRSLRELVEWAKGGGIDSKPSLEAQAIALLLRDGPNVAQVARTLGVPRQRLYRLPRFVECLERMTGPKRTHRGYKTTEGLEAISD